MTTPPEIRSTAPPPPPPPPSPEQNPPTRKSPDHNFNPISDPNNNNEQESPSPSTSSSFSSTDSDSDFFQINPPELDLTYTPPSPSPSPSPNPNPNPNSEKPPGIEINPKSPPIQTMVRDPTRIPSSIFGRAAAEWSVASNESLFSIHVGNRSFSRDEMALNGGEWSSPEMGAAAAAAASLNAEAMREVMRAAAEGRESERKVVLGRSFSRGSDHGSTTSFAFPILSGDGRIGSIKVNFEHHKDHQPNTQIKPSKIVAEKAPTATMRSHLRAAHSQSLASVRRRWFPRFPGCKFCCCRCDY